MTCSAGVIIGANGATAFFASGGVKVMQPARAPQIATGMRHFICTMTCGSHKCRLVVKRDKHMVLAWQA